MVSSGFSRRTTKISGGPLRKVCGKLATSLDQTCAELLAALPHQDRLNVDDTGHKENGKGMWTWCFRAPLFTLFRIDPSRVSQVLVETLGTEFDGVLECDCFSAYRAAFDNRGTPKLPGRERLLSNEQLAQVVQRRWSPLKCLSLVCLHRSLTIRNGHNSWGDAPGYHEYGLRPKEHCGNA